MYFPYAEPATTTEKLGCGCVVIILVTLVIFGAYSFVTGVAAPFISRIEIKVKP
jgi:hypothetical protein